jgi:hypothetical protein
VLLLPVRGFIIYQKHVLFSAGYVRDHAVGTVRLLHMPFDVRIGLFARKLRMRIRPELRKIEFIGRSFIPESRKQLSLQGNGAGFRTASADFNRQILRFVQPSFTVRTHSPAILKVQKEQEPETWIIKYLPCIWT